MRTRIKICGVREVGDALAAVAAGADAVGLVFAEGSPRFVEVERAGEIVRSLPAFVDAAGLFVNASVEEILGVVKWTGIGTVQLHGDEPVSILDELGGLSVVRALPFTADAGEVYADWLNDPRVCGVVWDSPPDAKGRFGGTGNALPWSDLRARLDGEDAQSWPVPILAGGLTAENVGEAFETVSPYAVDVSSGVESSRGVKDREMIAAFCKAVGRADRGRIL